MNTDIEKTLAELDRLKSLIGEVPDKLSDLYFERRVAFRAALDDKYDELAAHIRALQGVVERLPVTNDGVRITPGMHVWCIRTARWKWVGERGTSSYRGVEDYTDYPRPVACTVAHLGALGSELQRLGVVLQGMSVTEMTKPEWCYSTEQAAKAALSSLAR